jgi:hypothetical protein
MKRLLFVLMICLFPFSVKADTSQYQYYVGALIPCLDAPLNAGAVTCEVVPRVWGFSILTLEFDYTDHAAGGGTGFTAQVQACNEGYGAGDCLDATDWSLISTESIVGGIVTLTPAIITVASDASIQQSWSIGINYRRLRVVVTGSGAPVATDKITVKAMLAIP